MIGIKSSTSIIIVGVFNGKLTDRALVAISDRQIYIIKHLQFFIFTNATLDKKIARLKTVF